MSKTSADIRKELAAAEARERAETLARKETTKPQFEYWIAPAKVSETASYGKLYDPTCCLYELKRTTLNFEDARAVGWTEDDMREGTATYLYNIVTRRVVCAVGGGTTYINRSFGAGPEDFEDDTAFYHLGGYLAQYPGGGDVTYIVEAFQVARKAASNGHKIS